MALPTTDTRTLNTLVSATLDTYSGDPANLVDEGGFKIFGKLARAGRIFAVNDAERVEHPVMHGADGESTTRYVGTEFDGNPASNNLGVAQAEVLSKALFTIKNVTTNLNLPQELIGRPSQLAMTEVQALTKRKMMNLLAEEEYWLLRGVGTATGTEAIVDPFSGDANWAATNGSMSMLGLMGTGKITNTEKFANIDTQDAGDGDSDWAPQLYQGSTAAMTDLDEVIQDFQDSIIDCSRFGGIERPTDILTTVPIYNKFVEALREKTSINDAVVRNLGVESEIPFAGVKIDFSHHLDKDALWDITAETTPEHPVLMLNLNSLRMNLVYGGDVTQGGGFVKRVSDVAPHPTNTTFFARLLYKYCYSLDNGRRSFGQIEGWNI